MKKVRPEENNKEKNIPWSPEKINNLNIVFRLYSPLSLSIPIWEFSIFIPCLSFHLNLSVFIFLTACPPGNTSTNILMFPHCVHSISLLPVHFLIRKLHIKAETYFQMKSSYSSVPRAHGGSSDHSYHCLCLCV